MNPLLYFNGINATTGIYNLPPCSMADFVKQIPLNLPQQASPQTRPHPSIKLSEAGWGLVLPPDADSQVIEALQPLLTLRRQQAGSAFQIITLPHNASTETLFQQYPQLPYYLLLVGSPTEISYTLQQQLSHHYAVGRLYFDTLSNHYDYAQAVVISETKPLKIARQLDFFWSSYAYESLQYQCIKKLWYPLYKHLKTLYPTWDLQFFLEKQALKTDLVRLFGTQQTRALLITTGHGISQATAFNGGLLTHNWPGNTPISADQLFTHTDLNPTGNPLGLIWLNTVSDGLGINPTDPFSHSATATINRLPQRLLQQGALAVIGYVGRAWGNSIPDSPLVHHRFQAMVSQMLAGQPIGLALAQASRTTSHNRLQRLLKEYQHVQTNRPDLVDKYLTRRALEIGQHWLAMHDASNLMILGDPAVQLPVAADNQKPEPRPLFIATPFTPAKAPLSDLSVSAHPLLFEPSPTEPYQVPLIQTYETPAEIPIPLPITIEWFSELIESSSVNQELARQTPIDENDADENFTVEPDESFSPPLPETTPVDETPEVSPSPLESTPVASSAEIAPVNDVSEKMMPQTEETNLEDSSNLTEPSEALSDYDLAFSNPAPMIVETPLALVTPTVDQPQPAPVVTQPVADQPSIKAKAIPQQTVADLFPSLATIDKPIILANHKTRSVSMTNIVMPEVEPSELADDLLVFNGINGATGEYGLPPMTESNLTTLIQGEADKYFLEDLATKKEQPNDPDNPYGSTELPTVPKSGWGLVFAKDDPQAPAIEEALSALIKLRSYQANGPYAGQPDEDGIYTEGGRFRIFKEEQGYQKGQSKRQWLGQFGVGTGVVDPKKGVPYFLLLVGSPEQIPYHFQFQLDVQFAVGRIYFETLDEYANYAHNVVDIETGQVQVPLKATFWGVTNNNDRATQLSTKHQIVPIYNQLVDELPSFVESFPDWVTQNYTSPQWRSEALIGRGKATKAGLSQLLTTENRPGLLFTSSHGLEFPSNHKKQRRHQGALLCNDWPGPRRWRKPIIEDHYFSQDDVDSSADLRGLMIFSFACFGAGCPRRDEFAYGKKRPEIAPQPFLAGLPTKLLGKKNGALAFIGHVERAWGYSIVEKNITGGRNTTTLYTCLEQLMIGELAGEAMDPFDLRFAELATDLTAKMEQLNIEKYDLSDTEYAAKLIKDAPELASMWTEHNDARGYIVIGDPAARLPFTNDFEPTSPAYQTVDYTDANLSAVKETATNTDDEASFSWYSSKTKDQLAREKEAQNATQPDSKAISEQPTTPPTPVETEDNESNLTELLQTMGSKFSNTMANVFEDLTTIRVYTYTGDDIDTSNTTYNPKTKQFDNAKLRAATRIEIDGDVINLVPKASEDDSGVNIDEQLWNVHKEMVDLAQQNRTDFILAVGEIMSMFVKK